MNTKSVVSAITYALLLGMGGSMLYLQWRQFKSGEMPVPSGNIGPVIERLGVREHHATMLLVLKIGCEYCERSLPFYARLAAERRPLNEGAMFLEAVFPDDARLAQQYLRIHDLNLPVIGAVKLADVKVSGTPTVLIVDSKGEIKRAWVGALDPGGEQDVTLSLLRARQEITDRRRCFTTG